MLDGYESMEADRRNDDAEGAWKGREPHRRPIRLLNRKREKTIKKLLETYGEQSETSSISSDLAQMPHPVSSKEPQRVRALSRLHLHGRVAARRGSENALSLTTKSGTDFCPFRALFGRCSWSARLRYGPENLREC